MFSSLTKLQRKLIVGLLSLYYALKIVRVENLLPSFIALQPNELPKISLQNSTIYNGNKPSKFYDIEPEISIGPLGFLLVISIPLNHSDSIEVNTKINYNLNLKNWYNENRNWFEASIQEYGTVLLRGFHVVNVFDFDSFVANIHAATSNGTGIYLGFY
jgi:hypothetical protein